ncbi:MAG: KEOPS complex kinase/ATPase Bud32 [Candidatus Diapherotrites archaeon]
MRLIAKGAEAELWRTDYLGRPALVKRRVPKKYRNSALDARIRRLRTKEECLLLHRAKECGVRAPLIYNVDRAGTEIVMEFVDGEKLRDVMRKKGKNKKNVFGFCSEVGRNVAKLHRGGLVHGDLTTSNIIVPNQKPKKTAKAGLVFVDFGLGFMSSRTEDFAVDLLVFKKTFSATHWELMPKGWEAIMQGYARGNPKGREIERKVEAVEGRVRYH